MVLVGYVLCFLLPWLDVYTDFKTGISYFPKDPWFGWITVIVPFFPFFVKMVMEVWYTLKYICNSPQLFKAVWKEFSFQRIKNTIFHLPFIAPLINVGSIIQLTLFKDGQPGAESIQLEMGTNGNWEPFLESGPQLVLQLYILIEKPPQDLSTPITSIVLSIISICVASGGTFLLDRVKYPIGSDLKAKMMLAMLFVFVLIPRTLNLALLSYILNNSGVVDKSTGRILFCVFIVTGICMVYAAVRKATISELPPKVVWDSKVEYDGEDHGIKGEYKKEKERGYDAYMKELSLKTCVLSIMVPCIVIFQKSGVFPVTAITSTVVHVFGLIIGWTMFKLGPEFDTNMNRTWNNNSTLPTLQDPADLKMLLPVTTAFLTLSTITLSLLWYASTNINLKHLMKKLELNLTHSSLIGIAIEEEAVKENAMEQKAKALGGDYRFRLSQLRNKEKTSIHNDNDTTMLSKLSKEDMDFRSGIVTRRKTHFTITEVPLKMVKELRWCEDHLPSILNNIQRNINKDEEKTSTEVISSSNSESQIYNLVDQNELGKLYKCIQQTSNIDAPNDDGDTGLIKAVREENYLATMLLLMEGSSVGHKNHKNEDAFAIALKQEDDKIKQMLWEHLQQQNEHYEMFVELCGKGDIESVQFCLKNMRNDRLRKQLIEWNQNDDKMFPLLYSITWRKEDVALLLINYHKQLNKKCLFQRDLSEYNALIYASQAGMEQVIEHIITTYDEHNMIAETEMTGRNALIMASEFGYENIVKTLIPYFEKLNKLHEKDNVGRTALDWAKDNQHTNVVKLLEKYF